jgi:hypothetical protein
MQDLSSITKPAFTSHWCQTHIKILTSHLMFHQNGQLLGCIPGKGGGIKVLANGKAGNTKGGSITVPLTSCLTGLD